MLLGSRCGVDLLALFCVKACGGSEIGSSDGPVYLLLGMLALGTLAFAWPVSHLEEFRVSIQLGLAALTTLAMLALSYWLFRVDEARSLLWERIAGRFPAFATRRS